MYQRVWRMLFCTRLQKITPSHHPSLELPQLRRLTSPKVTFGNKPHLLAQQHGYIKAQHFHQFRSTLKEHLGTRAPWEATWGPHWDFTAAQLLRYNPVPFPPSTDIDSKSTPWKITCWSSLPKETNQRQRGCAGYQKKVGIPLSLGATRVMEGWIVYIFCHIPNCLTILRAMRIHRNV